MANQIGRDSPKFSFEKKINGKLAIYVRVHV